MLENDYLMRQIHEIVYFAMKWLWGVDTYTEIREKLSEDAKKEALERYLDMADKGLICDAEDEIFDLIDKEDTDVLMIGIAFYAHLNEFEDKFLEENDFSRGEVKSGYDDLIRKYDLDALFEQVNL